MSDPPPAASSQARAAPAAGRGARAWRWAGELGWVLPAVAGVALLAGRAHQDVRVPVSGGWIEYLQWVELFRDPARVALLNAWRKPTWGLLVASWATLSGRETWEAAFDVAQGSVALVVLAAAVLVRALAGRLPAAFVGLLAMGFPVLVLARLWLDPYPAVGAAVAVALALGAVAARWASPVAALGGSLAAGLAFALDGRAANAIPSVLALAALAPLPGRRWRRVALVALCALAVSVGPGAERWAVRRWCLPQMPFLEQIAIQHGHRDEFEAPPTGLDTRDPAAVRRTILRLATDALSPAGRALRVDALRVDARGLLAGPALWLLPLLLVPTRGQPWRSWLAGLAVFAPALALPYVEASLVTMFPRYLAPTWCVTLALAPIALARLVSWLPARLPAAAKAATCATALTAWALLGWPGRPALLHPPLLMPHTVDADPAFRLAAWLLGRASPGDRFVDCGETHLGPLIPAALAYTDDPGGARPEWWQCGGGAVLSPSAPSYSTRLAHCAAWAAAPPPGRTWISLRATHQEAHADAEEALRATLATGGWERVRVPGVGDDVLWTRASPSPAPGPGSRSAGTP